MLNRQLLVPYRNAHQKENRHANPFKEIVTIKKWDEEIRPSNINKLWSKYGN